MKQLPRTVLATLLLISLNALFWLGFAVMAGVGAIPSFEGAGAVRWMLAGLSLGAAICLGGMAYFLMRRRRFAFHAGVILLTVIAVLSITDQIGLADVLTLLSILAALVLLLKDRAWYLQSNTDGDEGERK